MEGDQVYRLRLLSPLHVGERGVGMEEAGETVPSDTLFSALCWALGQAAGEGWLREWLEAFAGRPAPLLISSTFPWAGDVRFYPRPMVRIRSSDEEGEGAGAGSVRSKQLKKATRVSEGVFRRLLAGESLEGEMERSNFLAGGLWITAIERRGLPRGLEAPWLAPEPLPHVALDRRSGASSLYHVGEVRYHEGCGLWFAVRWREPAWREPLEMALSCLGEAGVGGERSAGRGQFRWERWEEAALPDEPAAPDRAVTLSLYHPTREEVAGGVLDRASYRLALRRGWLSSPSGQGLRGRAVRMLAEGSVVAPPSIPPGTGGQDHLPPSPGGSRGASDLGDLPEVTPEGFRDHPVYRYGLAFPLGLRGGDDG